MQNVETETRCPICRQKVTTFHIKELKNCNIEPYIEKFSKWIQKAELDNKDYQLDAIKWCLNNELNPKSIFNAKSGGILADEMGLGKTIIMLGLTVANPKEHTLVICPPILLEQWENCIINFMNKKPLVYYGTNKQTIDEKVINESTIVLTSYYTLMNKSLLHMVNWDRLIFDEAHHMRNQKKTFEGARQLTTNSCWLVTGTPIQNRLKDLHAYWELLGINKSVYNERSKLLWITREYILRRTKEEVHLEIPNMHEHVIKVPWETDYEKELAEDLHNRLNFTKITKENISTVIQALSGRFILPKYISCRQACIYPPLLKKKLNRYKKKYEDMTERNEKAFTCSSKTNAIINLIKTRNNKNKNKKLIFGHFKDSMNYLKTNLTKLEYETSMITGETTKDERVNIIKNKPDILIMHIQVGCEGLNLQDYKEVYFTSPFWNPAIEDQAVARCHRLGQTEEIHVFRFVMEEFGTHSPTIDEYCLEIQQKKKELLKIYENKN
uniref:Helicase n=1 Tax=viral metagenome TaxID=1070528 RepID=A0A6C0KGH9_9ZZZZ